MDIESGNQDNKNYVVGAWKDSPESWSPAIVLISLPKKNSNGLASIFLTDYPDFKTGNGMIVLPEKETETYFKISGSQLCPEEFAGEFSEMQQYLISNNMPMMGPLFYLRTATMMKYQNLPCAQAIDRNAAIESSMQSWIKDGNKIIWAMMNPD